jgi:hypothetical protein
MAPSGERLAGHSGRHCRTGRGGALSYYGLDVSRTPRQAIVTVQLPSPRSSSRTNGSRSRDVEGDIGVALWPVVIVGLWLGLRWFAQ